MLKTLYFAAAIITGFSAARAQKSPSHTALEGANPLKGREISGPW